MWKRKKQRFEFINFHDYLFLCETKRLKPSESSSIVVKCSPNTFTPLTVRISFLTVSADFANYYWTTIACGLDARRAINKLWRKRSVHKLLRLLLQIFHIFLYTNITGDWFTWRIGRKGAPLHVCDHSWVRHLITHLDWCGKSQTCRLARWENYIIGEQKKLKSIEKTISFGVTQAHSLCTFELASVSET